MLRAIRAHNTITKKITLQHYQTILVFTTAVHGLVAAKEIMRALPENLVYLPHSE